MSMVMFKADNDLAIPDLDDEDQKSILLGIIVCDFLLVVNKYSLMMTITLLGLVSRQMKNTSSMYLRHRCGFDLLFCIDQELRICCSNQPMNRHAYVGATRLPIAVPISCFHSLLSNSNCIPIRSLVLTHNHLMGR